MAGSQVHALTRRNPQPCAVVALFGWRGESVGTESWWARTDSNREPRDYESPALTVELQALCLFIATGVILHYETSSGPVLISPAPQHSCVAFSPPRAMLVIACSDRASPPALTVELQALCLFIATGTTLHHQASRGPVLISPAPQHSCVAFSPPRAMLVIACGDRASPPALTVELQALCLFIATGVILHYETSSGPVLISPAPQHSCVAFSPPRAMLVIACSDRASPPALTVELQALCLFIATGTTLHHQASRGPVLISPAPQHSCVAFSPPRAMLVIAWQRPGGGFCRKVGISGNRMQERPCVAIMVPIQDYGGVWPEKRNAENA